MPLLPQVLLALPQQAASMRSDGAGYGGASAPGLRLKERPAVRRPAMQRVVLAETSATNAARPPKSY